MPADQGAWDRDKMHGISTERTRGAVGQVVQACYDAEQRWDVLRFQDGQTLRGCATMQRGSISSELWWTAADCVQ